MEDILNYIKINELIHTSGQPTIEQFSKLKEEEFEVIINIALCNSSNALENEDKIVSELGMTYIHLPIDFEEPKLSDLKLFINILQSLGANKVLVHCAKNYRVSAFMYVYHKYILQTPFDNIDLSMFEQWSPNKTWQSLMKVSFDDLKKAY
ncbi:protein tyrosine phosphatase family protein [Arcobacter sp. YIC-464]|uniref:protein tyrosine phosphatase family protein n=1 Tax=Arcobacter sp. YIC-464 TaxID=3376631 RepID=UPI003C1DE0DD